MDRAGRNGPMPLSTAWPPLARVPPATDDDFNAGLSRIDALTGTSARKRDSGTYLRALGFGRGNLDDATVRALAQNANGIATHADTLGEAPKVLVDQLTGALDGAGRVEQPTDRGIDPGRRLPAGAGARFAAAIAASGQLLQGADWLGSRGRDDAITLAAARRVNDVFGPRSEAFA